MTEIEVKVRSIIAEVLSLDENQVSLDSTLFELDAKEMDKLDIFLYICEVFGIQAPNTEVNGIKTGQQAVEYIEQKISAR